MLRRKIGQCYVVRRLGSGGVWDVYLAINPKTGERRAIKFLPPASATQQAQPRFLREIDRARSLLHPRIVKVIESGTLEDCCYYSMQFYAGRDLSSHLGRSMPVRDALRLFGGICDGLAYAHARGIAHGNLKPSKVLIDASGLPAIAGFGISSALHEHRNTPQPRLPKTPRVVAYAPPEHRRGLENVDRRADVYSLGALLYAMLMGFPPLGQYPRPADVKTGIPAAVQQLLERCLAPDPEERPCDATVLQEELPSLGRASGEKVLPQAPEDAGNDKWAPVSDRIEGWFELLRRGSTRDRLGAVREMVEEMGPGEANAVLKLYPNEEDRVRWGLMRVFGELRISAASPMIVGELQNPFHRDCAVEALGKIGSRDAFVPILEFLRQHPEAAIDALLPLASTGGPRAVQYLQPYLSHPRAPLRLCAIRALAAIGTPEAFEALRAHLTRERDERLRSELARFIQGRETSRLHASDPVPAALAPNL